MEVRKIETPEGKLLRIGFARTAVGENLREEINKWLEVNYPKMSFEQFWERLSYMTPDLWTIVME